MREKIAMMATHSSETVARRSVHSLPVATVFWNPAKNAMKVHSIATCVRIHAVPSACSHAVVMACKMGPLVKHAMKESITPMTSLTDAA
jgi:hypothetical protein